MSLRSSKTAAVSSPVPRSTPPAAVVAQIHNHVFIIEASAYAFSSEQVPIPDALAKTAAQMDAADSEAPLPGAAWTAYLVHERIPYYGTVSFHVALKNYPNGSNQVVHAPQGLVMKAKSRVVSQDHGQSTYVDECTFEVNRLLMPFVIRSWDRANHDLHQLVLDRAQAQAAGAGDDEQASASSRPGSQKRPSWVKRRMSSFSIKQKTAA